MRGLLLATALLSGCAWVDIPDYTSGLDGGPQCEAPLRRCAVPFELRYANETSAELRGSFRDAGWSKGEPMARVSGRWSATVEVPYGVDVQYKFYVDGTTWLVDPANTRTAKDEHGNTNSLLPAVQCASWTCVTP